MLALILHGHSSKLLQRAELVLFDLWLPDTPRLEDPRIQIVDIDDQSLATIGRWPWPRDQLAQLLEKILEQKPAALGLDILLPEPGTSVGDHRLNRALQDPRVIAATSFKLEDATVRQRDTWARGKGQINLAHTLTPHNTAHIMPIHDIDGVIRRMPPIICQNEECYPAMAVSLLETLTASQAEYNQNTQELCIAGMCQPINRAKELLIPYRPGTVYRFISATHILSGQAQLLPGSLILVGSSATGLGDIISTPVSARTPGILVHAAIISSWLDNYSLQQSQHTLTIHLGIWLASLSSILIWGAGQTHIHKTLALLCLLMPAPVLVGFWHSHYWLNPVPCLLMLMWSTLSITGLQLSKSQASRRQLQQAFASYVPPVVLEQLSRGGHNLKQLDAQRAEISILFADIQGFTALSEQMTPEQLVQLTNLLFTELTEEIHAHQGTLDKYMGDAIMAFWGAPLPKENHAELALNCAHAMQARLKKLQPKLTALSLPRVNIAIGIEAGTVIAGNLGAEQRRAYTVLGSAVNTAARIQAAASDINHEILLGPQFCAKLPSRLKTRPLLHRSLKGINRPLLLSIPDTSAGKHN